MRRTRSQTLPPRPAQQQVSGSPTKKNAHRRKQRSQEPTSWHHRINITKPKYNSPPQKTPPTSLGEKIELCDLLVTEIIQKVNPELKPYLHKLKGFKMFKDINVQMTTVKLLNSDIGELDQEDRQLEKVLKEEDDAAFYKRFGMEFDE